MEVPGRIRESEITGVTLRSWRPSCRGSDHQSVTKLAALSLPFDGRSQVKCVPSAGPHRGTGPGSHLMPAEKLTTGKNSPSRLKDSKTPCTGQPLIRKEMDGTLRSRQQLTTSSGASRCCPGEVTGRATCPTTSHQKRVKGRRFHKSSFSGTRGDC